MKPEDAREHTDRCFRGEPATCTFACPFRMDIRSFLDKAARGRWPAAYRTLRDAVVFPAVVSVLCDQPCRGACQRTLLGDEALELRELEAACLRNVKERKPERYVIPPKKERVAVVGAGPSGLACALALAQKRFRVTVFERGEGWGGRLREHPRFAEFDEDIALQFSALEAQFRFGAEVGGLGELSEFDAVYVATGAGGDAFGLEDSWNDRLHSTADPRVFLGGELCGSSVMEALAAGTEASRSIEVFLQTGKAAATFGRFPRDYGGHAVPHEGVPPAPAVRPADPSGYSGEEARAEAARCMQCDCNICMEACEMLRLFRKDPHKIAVEVYTDTHVNAPFSSHTITREAYSCNICGYCGSVCPVGVNIGPLLQLSRRVRTSAGVHPAALHDFWLREMDFAVSEGAFAAPPAGREECAYAFYPGCQLGASSPEHVLRSWEFLAARHDAGVMLGCCGAPAYWAGDDDRLRANIEEIERAWTGMGRPVLVCACATCRTVLAGFLPGIRTVSLYELLAEAEEVRPARLFPEAAVFDPCAARGADRVEAAVRTLLSRSGAACVELAEKNRCCGHGGHIYPANPALAEEIARNRAEADARPYVVYCANCREVFASRGKACAHILDMVFDLPVREGVPGLDEKRANSLEVKRELMKRVKGADFEAPSHPWDTLTLVIDGGLRRTLDRKLISAADIKEAVWRAESTGDRFLDEGTGACLCSMVKEVITYWVEYRGIADGTFEILDAYTHRMRFTRGE